MNKTSKGKDEGEWELRQKLIKATYDNRDDEPIATIYAVEKIIKEALSSQEERIRKELRDKVEKLGTITTTFKEMEYRPLVFKDDVLTAIK